ncbi:MAG: DUF2892 domain-containing protein [Phycisphaerales bacterium JB059]
MRPNEGSIDRVVRLIFGGVLLAAALLWLGLMDASLWGILAAVVGVVLVLTAAIGFCPAYKLCGLSTCRPRGA